MVGAKWDCVQTFNVAPTLQLTNARSTFDPSFVFYQFIYIASIFILAPEHGFGLRPEFDIMGTGSFRLPCLSVSYSLCQC